MGTSPQTLRLLAISGSLRASSVNTAVLRAIITLNPDDMVITLYGDLAALPHFNPDLDGENAPPQVAAFRRLLTTADGVLISSPECAHGVPGVMKNALDWVVGSGEFVDKPVALISASPHATRAQASLTETLTMMAARLIAEASITLLLTTNRINEAGISTDPKISHLLRTALAAFTLGIRNGSTERLGLKLATSVSFPRLTEHQQPCTKH